MPRFPRPLPWLATAVAVALAAIGGAPRVTAPVPVAAAASVGWTTPTEPPECNAAQTSSGNVAGCVITTDLDMPELLGWPTAPFPSPTDVQVIPWVDLGQGSSGETVRKVQQALIERGAPIAADGAYGPVTAAAVSAHQTTVGLAATGIVDRATATSLGVENTTAGTFPPAGWNWLGWGYNSSAALSAWERGFVSNANQIGSLRPGVVRAFPEVLPLWEGFLAEIQTRGYQIRNGGTYVFRCTAVTRKDCYGLTAASLSNHSYGLAADLNIAENPLRTYYGTGGRSACATPMLTDMPQWVVQTAEKWGFYWGGYGWSAGCRSPAEYRSSAFRDPMHFEFNGTPAMARAILLHNTGGGLGACVDVADATGVVAERCYQRNEVPPAGTRTVVHTGAPAGATGALVNIAATAMAGNGYFTAESCEANSTVPRPWSNGTVLPGPARSTGTIVPLDVEGRFCIYQSTSMHTIVDVQGWLFPAAAAPDGLLFTPVDPVRAIDTRTDVHCSPTSECADPSPVPPWRETVVGAPSPLVASAAIVNIAAVGAAANGYLTADSCDTLAPAPQTRATITFGTGAAVANFAVVPAVTNEQGVQFCAVASSRTHAVVDVQGWFGPADDGGLAYDPLTPRRLLDTRSELGERPAGSVMRLEIPAGLTAVALSVTGVRPASAGFVAVGRCSAFDAGTATHSNLNVVPNAAVTNMLVSAVEGGEVCIHTSTTMHLVVDLVGAFAPTGSQRFVPVTPVRVHDSRPPL